MQWLSHINQCNPKLWQSPSTSQYPFLKPAFLHALETSESIGEQSGWQAHYLTNSEQKNAQEWVIPAFIKHHSYGEYVFDWSWANAYEQHGYNYYPKLLIAAPFTPANGPRLFGQEQHTLKNCLPQIEQHCLSQRLSSAHCLFADKATQKQFDGSLWHRREGVQFHWFNADFQSFDDFLSTFKSRKRKAVKKERNTLNHQHIQIVHKTGNEISKEEWHFFYTCYQSTYLKRGMQGYLNLAAFQQMAITMPEHLLLMIAYDAQNQPLACALYFKDESTLYGRYWGCMHDIPGLHFEMCYYQGIEYCIQHRLKRFDPGTQGEHKISRGFEPISTYSYHWIAHPDFSRAIGDFVKEEAIQTAAYKAHCQSLLPFNGEHRLHQVPP